MLGVGCHQRESQARLRTLEIQLSNNHLPVSVLCDPSSARPITKVAGAYMKVPWAANASPSAFEVEVANMVRVMLQSGINVALAGHSYGGLVVSKVAGMLWRAANDGVDRRDPRHTPGRLDVATFGTIFIPPPSVPSVPIEHYLFHGDIARRFAKPNNADGSVVSLDPPYPGMTAWEIHNSYEYLVIEHFGAVTLQGRGR